MTRFRISYDKGAGVLYISLGEPKSAVTEAFPQGILVRTDRVSKEFVGVTVFDFSDENKAAYEEVLKKSHRIPEALLPQLLRELSTKHS